MAYIPQSDIVRLGNVKNASAAVQSLVLPVQKSGAKLARNAYTIINNLKDSIRPDAQALFKYFQVLANTTPTYLDLLEYLEFEQLDLPFFAIFTVPTEDDGMTKVGHKGKIIQPDYLIRQWVEGRVAKPFEEVSIPIIWSMNPEQRAYHVQQWKAALFKETISDICCTGERHDKAIAKVQKLWAQADTSILLSKRIIGCTTTAAAKYATDIQAASLQILLVEEAGEILESHIWTAMTPATQQLIMIGDHKQLRPNVNSYNLSVEKGDGYDLNRSMFERLVLKDHPHQVLSEQHRMRPEISALVRQLTYPDLKDAPETLTRSRLLGFTDNLVFVNHEHLEDETTEEPDWKAMTTKSSKQNTFEANMILKCVRYLGQQGYLTEDIVILTPYLGQLTLLIKIPGRDHDPVLNDLDSYDLVQAGLMPAETARLSKKQIKISTIGKHLRHLLHTISDHTCRQLPRSRKQDRSGLLDQKQL